MFNESVPQIKNIESRIKKHNDAYKESLLHQLTPLADPIQHFGIR